MNSQIIDEFIDHSASVPRDVVRICKMVKEVEDISNEKLKLLDEERRAFLENKRLKPEKNIELKQEIDKKFKELLDLNEYKQEQLSDLEFIINFHCEDLEKSIKEHEKEFRIQFKTSPNINISGKKI